MASILKLPKKVTQPQHQIKPRAAQRPNPARAINDREFRRKQAAAAAASAANTPPASVSGLTTTSRQQCPNKSCKNPNVVDGVCQTCGRIADDSNIVSEVQFGEASNGAAMVQGSFLGADQAGPRPMGGPGFRRIAGGGSGEARERSLREAKHMMEGFAHQLNISNVVVSNGHAIYRTAAAMNFIQGRGIQKVVAVCLYAACRKETPCKIMLIDLADLIKVDVFELGRTFKALLRVNFAARDRIQPIFAEDLIFRFAVKLEFDRMTNKIAETAVRIVQRMDRDWMVMGRKPAGICGCALIMAARMYNFRRTPMEVAFIAKVTMFTLTQRLDEFRYLKSADMRIEEFLSSDFLSGEHDPPSFYKQSEEWQAKEKERNKNRKRKRRIEDDIDPELRGDEDGTSPSPPDASDAVSTSSQQRNGPDASQPGQPSSNVDADGFVVPALPQKAALGISSDDQRALNEVAHSIGQELELLAEKYGGDEASILPGGGSPESQASSLDKQSGGSDSKKETPEWLTAEWEVDEQEIEAEITEKLSDPSTPEHARAFANAEQRARLMVMAAEERARREAASRPAIYQAKISDAPEVEEDEFEDDPEVANCLLTEEERRIKEQVWLNENRDWLRAKQEKEYKAKMAPPKKTRRRAKRPRLGEGQASPASTAGEASEQALRRHAVSRRLDYSAMRKMVDTYARKGPGSTVGSEITSRQTSIAGSTMGDDDQSRASEEPEESEAGDDEEEAGEQDDDATHRAFDDDDEGEEDIDPFADDDQGAGGEEED
ncbi:Transcription factor tfiiib complex subunit [Pleurostoma richardsiae]|uniref:Transcription factor tfiiib complex subunit n=1 Tax=Pleurostoma richardsiae TaxID=41990 RepID=A0AA38RA14_9PEZI|nr:Transcription factor tfiiib complex subunit [Pleurostoma richardsiae]